MKLLPNKTYRQYQLQAGSTLKFEKGCTALNKQISWQTNYYNKYWNLMGNTLYNTHLDYGYIKQG
jgi:hypothetical protein